MYKKPLICNLFYSFLYGVLDQLSVVQLSNPVPLDSPISPSVPAPTGRFCPRRSKQTPCSFIHIKYICKIRGFACSKCPRIVLSLRKKPHYFDLKKKFDEIFLKLSFVHCQKSGRHCLSNVFPGFEYFLQQNNKQSCIFLSSVVH